ncbi:putative Fructose-bisphosphate aldolase class-I [Leishmania utingensis]|uniref:Fructose-bisphosphate aldolase class-I n=1 Tax=Leishmania utingensis TaxID=653362 RepID=A0AAW3B0W7_9TRYP
MNGYVGRMQYCDKLDCRFCKWCGGYSRQNWNVLEPLIQFNTDTQSRLSLSGLVSIVEPNVMLGGTLGAEMWESVFTVLHHHGVIRKGMFLKSSIVFARFERGVKC